MLRAFQHNSLLVTSQRELEGSDWKSIWYKLIGWWMRKLWQPKWVGIWCIISEDTCVCTNCRHRHHRVFDWDRCVTPEWPLETARLHFFLPDCLHGLFSGPFLLSYSVFDFIFCLFFVSGTCARLSWPSHQLLSARKSTVSYRHHR